MVEIQSRRDFTRWGRRQCKVARTSSGQGSYLMVDGLRKPQTPVAKLLDHSPALTLSFASKKVL